MLEIKNLKASVNDKNILNGLNLKINAGEVHAIMGPNGSGKSTLANILTGKEGYNVSGEIKFEGENLNKVPIEERAQKGIFLAFQYPLEIPGVNTNNFLKTSLNTSKKARETILLQYCSTDNIVKIPANYEYPNTEWSDKKPPCILVSGTDKINKNIILDKSKILLSNNFINKIKINIIYKIRFKLKYYL